MSDILKEGASPTDPVLCTWPDGWKLRRHPKFDPPDPMRVMFDLYDGLGNNLDRLILYNGGDGLPNLFDVIVDPDVNASWLDEERRFPGGKGNLFPRERLSWFLWASIPDSMFRQFLFHGLVDKFCLPRELDERLARLTKDCSEEAEAKATHEMIERLFLGDPGSMNAQQFKTSGLLNKELLKRLAEEFFYHQAIENIHSYGFLFEANENIFWARHGLLAKKKGEPKRTGASYEPPLKRVDTRWVASEKPASWYIMDAAEVVVGAGDTLRNALRDVPFLVWPGERAEWEAKHFKAGTFTYDPALSHALGEMPPWFWPDEAFLEWEKGMRG